MRIPFFLAILTLSLAAEEEPWKRHTIDDSSQGADGVRLKDVNGDGHLDIATAWEEGGVVRAYLHPGPDKATSAWPCVTVGEVKSGEDAVYVDLDGDRSVDVLSSCEGKTKSLFVHWAPADPGDYLTPQAWKTEAVPVTANQMMWMYALPMQIDDRHGIDLIVAGKGTNAEIGWLAAPKNPRDLVAWKYETIAPLGWAMSILAVDLDDDNQDEVLYSDRRGDQRGLYWLDRVDGKWKRHAIPDSARENMFLATGDLDGDQQLDIVCAIRDGPIIWHQRQGDTWIAHEIPLPDGVGTGKSAAIADINADGRQDIVFTCEQAKGELSGVRWLSYATDPINDDWQSHEIGGAEGIKFDRLALDDVDDDGDLDVITCEERDQLGVIWYENPTKTAVR